MNRSFSRIASLLVLLGHAAKAEVPFDPPGSSSSSWLGNTYMDAQERKNITEELADNQYWNIAKNGDLFTVGDPQTIIHYTYRGLD